MKLKLFALLFFTTSYAFAAPIEFFSIEQQGKTHFKTYQALFSFIADLYKMPKDPETLLHFAADSHSDLFSIYKTGNFLVIKAEYVIAH